MKFVNHLDLNKLELRFGVLHPLGAAPGTPVVGQMYYDTAALAPRFWNGTAFTNVATDSPLHGGQTLAYVLSRGNHTGTQTASTISDLATTVQAYRLDQFAIPTADLNLNSRKITGLADPTNPQDAATMSYVQTQVANAAAGIDAKASVRFTTTANITLSGLATQGGGDWGAALTAGDRILVKNQSTASANGVYIAAGGAWTRATDADNNGEITPGAFWFVEEGSTLAKTQWRVENTGTIVVGTTAITINQFGAAGAAYTGSTSILLTGNAFSVIVKAQGGILAGANGLEVDTAIVARKFSASIGDGSATTLTVTHNLGTQDVTVSVREVSTNAVIFADVVAATTNTVTVAFATAPTANQYRVTVVG